MISKASIDEFLAQRRIAVVGFSRSGRKFGNAIFRALKAKGCQVFPVNPQATTIEGEPCYLRVQELPEAIEGAVLVIRPSETKKVVQDIAQTCIRRVWLQPGSESIPAVTFCRETGISVIYGECLLMFLEPTAFVHRMHRCVKRLLGRLPK